MAESGNTIFSRADTEKKDLVLDHGEASEFMPDTYDWYERQKDQEYEQRQKMFVMVYWMTVVTYVVVLVFLCSQFVDLTFPRSFSWEAFLGVVRFENVDIAELSLLLTGFLAELLLLPKIILSGLFTGNNNS